MQQLFTFVPALLAHHKKNPKHVAKASRSIKQHDTKGGSEEQKRGRWHEQQQQQSFVACFSFVRTKKKGCHRSVSVVCRLRYTTNAHACTAAPNHGNTQIINIPKPKKKRRRCPREKDTHQTLAPHGQRLPVFPEGGFLLKVLRKTPAHLLCLFLGKERAERPAAWI